MKDKTAIQLPSQCAQCGTTDFPLPSALEVPPEVKHIQNEQPLSQSEATALEQRTITQASCAEWFAARSHRITASQCGKIIKRKREVTSKFLAGIFGRKDLHTEATEYGKSHENAAKLAYTSKKKNIHLHDCGLVVHQNFNFLGASPDGKVCDSGLTGILEIKCPYSARDMSVVQAATNLANFCLGFNDNLLKLKENPDYFIQVQVQLMTTEAPFCDFVVYTSCNVYIERVLPDVHMQQEMLNKLSHFYSSHALPYLKNK